MSKQSILKWGNSLGFRLPAEIARAMQVCEGTRVTYTLKGKRLVVEAADPELPSFTEADLARAMRKLRKSKPRLVSYGKPRGREVW